MRKQLSIALLFFFFTAVCLRADAQTVYYVDSATGNDAYAGTSWATAFRNVTRAIAAANSSAAAEVDLWVAEGTYTPVDGIASLPADIQDTSFTFYRGNGVGQALKVYGGFAGTETSISMRDTSHHTYLDGNIGTGLKSYHVVVIAGLAIAADSLVIDELIIRNGRAADSLSKVYNGISINRNYGGGMLLSNNSSSQFAINNCQFTSDSAIGPLAGWSTLVLEYLGGAVGYGGGVYNDSSSALFSNCIFFSNSAVGGSPASSFGYNFAGAGYGGGICNNSSSSSFTNCGFISNNATGGGVLTISGNGGNGGGGGVFNILSDCEFVNCSFTSNLTTGGGADGTAGTMGAGGYGGAVCDSLCSPSFHECTFSTNTAFSNSGYPQTGSFGGGVYNKSNSNPAFDSCIFVTNTATNLYYSYGGAMYNDSSSPILNNCTFFSDSALGAGAYAGAIFNEKSSPVCNYCRFDNNISTVFFSAINCYAGAIYNDSSSVIFNNCSFTGNVTNCYPESCYGGALYNSFSSALFTLCTFTANSAQADAIANGGGIYNSFSTATFTQCGFDSNYLIGTYPGISGGAVYNDSSLSSFSLCTFNNNAAEPNPPCIGCVCAGGAVCSMHSLKSSFDRCTFSNNVATTYGGAIYQQGNKLTTSRCQFNTDTAQFGGAVRIDNSPAPGSFTGYDNVFVSNVSTYGGGAINYYMGGGIDTLINNLFIYNKDISDSGGGALHILGDTHYMTNNTFYADSAISGGRGGAIHFGGAGGNYTVANTIFYKNYGAGSSIDTSMATSGTYTFTDNSYSSTNPLFTNPANPIGPDGIWATADDGLHLQGCSPDRNTGLNSYVVAGETTEITGAERIEDAIVDLGAYESDPTGVIVGGYSLCAGFTEMLTDTTLGGTWISTNAAIATINSAGLLTAIATGTDTILYIGSGLCGTDTAETVLTVNSSSDAGTITGIPTVCVGATTVLGDTVTGGTWSVSNTNASVIGGTVTGLVAGTDIIIYTNSCGMATTTFTITINPFPSAGTITGLSTVCAGATISLSDVVTGGFWSAANADVSVVGGGITGVTAGIDTVTYSLSSACGTSTAEKTVTVNPLPMAGTITGTLTVCTGASTTLTDIATGGTWSESNTDVMLIGGTITGITVGTDSIKYTVTTSCGTAMTSAIVTIDPAPAAGAVTGLSTVCMGSTITLTDVASGGAWSAANTNATVSGGVVTGVAGGSDVISYSVTSSCGTAVATEAIAIIPLPTVAPITGATSVCMGESITVSDATGGGTWRATNANATISGTSVTGVTVGTDLISYSVTGSCGTTTETQLITINSAPTTAGSITGDDTVCTGSTITLTDGTGGGAWTTSDANASVSGGVVTGVSAGTDSVVYTVSNSCGSVRTAKYIHIRNCTSGINEITSGVTDLKVYPNPATDELTIENAEIGSVIKLFNMPGQLVYTIVVSDSMQVIDTHNLAGGTYIIQLTDVNGNRVNKTVVKE